MLSDLKLDRSYKFLELTPDLLKIIEKKKEKLILKAPNDDSDIVLCTSYATYQIRQRNHSNTVLVMEDTSGEHKGYLEEFHGFASMSSVFETKKVKGSVYVDDLPIYDGVELELKHDSVLIDHVRERSAISEKEFDKVWFENNGSALCNGMAVILRDELITKVLHILIMSITAADMNPDELSLIEVFDTVKEEATEFTIDIVETVLKKFSEDLNEPLKLDRIKISKWYGVHSLKKYVNNKMLTTSEFLIKWKSEIPPFFQCPLEISLLNGHFVTPLPEKIQYISKDSLPETIQPRLNYLFKLQSTWDLNELIPFISEFNVKDTKFEVFIMKYAKKKKIGKRILVTRR